jgi:hypothetical protein
MAKINTIHLQAASLHTPELRTPRCPISVPDYGETAAAVDSIYGSYIRRFDPDKPEEQFEVDVMAMSHVAIRRLAFCEAGVMETAAKDPAARSSSGTIPNPKGFPPEHVAPSPQPEPAPAPKAPPPTPFKFDDTEAGEDAAKQISQANPIPDNYHEYQ